MNDLKFPTDWINELDGLSIHHAIEYLERLDKHLILECAQHDGSITKAYFVNPITKEKC